MDENMLAHMLKSQKAKKELMLQRVRAVIKQRVRLKKQQLPSSAQTSKTIITRYQDGELRVFDVSTEAGRDGGSLSPFKTFRIESEDEVTDQTISPGLEYAVFATRNALVCVHQDGAQLWRYELQPTSPRLYGHNPSCSFSATGSEIWVYRPDSIAGRRGHDTLVVLRASSGEVITQADLSTTGHGASLLIHPDGQNVLLGVGEGQDGARIMQSSLRNDSLDVHSYGWQDRCLIDLAPDGKLFMTVSHRSTDIAFHRFPDGDVVLRLPAKTFEDEGDTKAARIDRGYGGFLTSDIALVTVDVEIGDGNDLEQRYHQVDLRSGTLIGQVEIPRGEEEDFEVPGDGSVILLKPERDVIQLRTAPVSGEKQ